MANWNIRLLLEEAKKAVNMKDLAQGIADQAQANIQSNNQVDTSFMRESTYILTKEGDSTYSQTMPNGDYFGAKSQRTAPREKAPQADLGDADAAVVVGAVYTIYNEIRDPFLYPALESAEAILAQVVKPF